MKEILAPHVTQASAPALSLATKQERLGGVDLMRMIAAFWVIYNHSGTISSITHTSASFGLLQIFSFHVPFFLLASFYFLAVSLAKDPAASSFSSLWRRTRRLVMLHLVWVSIYLALRVVKAHLQRQDLAQLLSDPVAFVLGGSAVHLYFIPLLLCGQFALWAALRSSQRTSVPAPASGAAAARGQWISTIAFTAAFLLLLALKTGVARSGNSFNMVSMRAFEALLPAPGGGQFVRVALVLVAHVIACGPLVMAALLMVGHLPGAAKSSGRYGLLALSFGVLCVLRWCPDLVRWEAAAISSFTFAYLLPLPDAPWTQQGGRFALGIYLMHQIPLEALDLLLSRAHVRLEGIATLGLLACSALSFAVCWAALAFVSSKAKTLKPIVGL